LRIIPLWHWAVGFLTRTLRPVIPAIPPFRPSFEKALSTDGRETAREQIVSTFHAKIDENQRRRNHAITQRGRCYAYLIVSLLALVASFLMCFGFHFLPHWVIFLPMIATLVSFEKARSHDHLARDCAQLLNLYHGRLQRVEHEWMGKGDPGVDLELSDHLSARDLDLFGEGSLFELLCDVQTPAGRNALAQWLQTPAPPDEVLSRQQAIRSLCDRADLRERLALLRGEETSEYSWNRLRDWLVASPVMFPRWAPWGGVLLSLALLSAALCGWTQLIAPHDALWIAAIIGTAQGALALFLRSRVRSILTAMHLPACSFESMRKLCSLVEGEPMDGLVLSVIQRRLRGSSKLVSQLQRLVRLRDMRDTELLFWSLLPLLWNTQWTMRIERWRQLHGHELLQYLTALGEFEAAMAIAAYAYENPSDPYPELVSEGPLLEAIGMGHPLMDVRTCVTNDVMLGGEKRFLLVTGSNMSGKSTLLRAVGLNATLAGMGAPVRAARLRLSPLQVCASIRIDDSLLNGRSHFYAEVDRLKAIFNHAASGSSVLFLIDELFGGTNSADRRVAAEAVIRLLIERQAIGLLTSHDLALTEIAEKSELKGANVHFADLPTAEGLSFDYHLRPGKVQHSNALKIIKMMGIPLN